MLLKYVAFRIVNYVRGKIIFELAVDIIELVPIIFAIVTLLTY